VRRKKLRRFGSRGSWFVMGFASPCIYFCTRYSGCGHDHQHRRIDPVAVAGLGATGHGLYGVGNRSRLDADSWLAHNSRLRRSTSACADDASGSS